MLGKHFQNESLRKFHALFGTLFNDIWIARAGDPSKGVPAQRLKVPISPAARERMLAITKAKPEGKKAQIQLPRMGFSIVGMDYDAERSSSRTHKYYASNGTTFFEPSKWNIHFQLAVIGKTQTDVYNIVEQILSYFRPDWPITVQMFKDIPEDLRDITIVYNGITFDDVTESDFVTRVAYMATFDFTMNAPLFGATSDDKIIKKVIVNTFALPSNDPAQTTVITAGVTADGKPTTNPDEAIPYDEVNPWDDWDFIVEYDNE